MVGPEKLKYFVNQLLIYIYVNKCRGNFKVLFIVKK